MKNARSRNNTWMLIRMMLLACALSFGASTFFSAPAYASPASSSGGSTASTPNCDKYKGLVNRFGSCIKETVLKVAVEYFDKMYSYFRTALNIVLTLGIVLYGVFLAAGMVENVKRDSMIVLLKVAFVAFFAANLEMIYFWVIDMMDGLIGLYFQFTNSMDEGKCSAVSDGFGPFKRLDCLLDLVIGLKSSSYQGSYTEKLSGDGVGRGFINFFFKAGVSSSIGALIAGVGFFIVYTLIFTVIKVTFMYLMSIIALSFMVMLGPIFIPLVLFKQTKGYFDSWVRLIVSFGLQPVIMFAYVAMMIIAFDKAVFSGSNSLMSSIVGSEADSASSFNLNEWMQNKNAIKREGRGIEAKADDSVKDTSGTKSPTESAIPGTVFRDLSTTGGASGAGGTGGAPSGGAPGASSNSVKTFAQHLPLNMVDWKKLAEARGKSEKDLMKEVLYAIIFVAMVVYVFTTMLNYIPSLGADISGGYGANLYQMVGQNPLEGAGKNLGGSIQQGLNRMLGSGKQGGGRS